MLIGSCANLCVTNETFYVRLAVKKPLITIAGKTKNELIVLAVAVVLTGLDLALLEKKFQIFSGGFLQSDQILSLVGRAKFIATILVLETAMAACFWYAFDLIGSVSGASNRLSRYRFLFIYGAGSLLILIAKYQILAYFGDFLSLAILRNLGGGSVQSALLYSLNEGLVFLGCAMLAFAIGWVCYRRLTRTHRSAASSAAATARAALSVKLAISFVVLGTLAFVSHQDAATRKQLQTVTPYWFADELNQVWRRPELSTLALVGAGMPAAAREPDYPASFAGKKDNLILIVSESTRADVLNARSGQRDVAPNWRSLAAEGGSAEKYYSHTGFTSSSLKAIFKGSLDAGAPSAETLFAALKRNGYQIVVISAQDESFGDISSECGEEKAADVFFDARSARDDRVFSSGASGSLALSNDRIIKQFDVIAASIDWKRPVFLYVNFQAAHFPYYYRGMPKPADFSPIERSEISFSARDKLKSTYLNAVASSDRSTGLLVARLKKLGVYDRSLVAVSGDHGESLFEDGMLGHGIRLTDTQLHTLLVANRHLPAFDNLIGQTDLARALLLGIGASFDGAPVRSRPSLIQYIGDLKEPSELGYVYPDGQRLRLNNLDGTLYASWLQHGVKVAALDGDSREYKALHRLIAEWRGIVK
jgi:glucan phosphoethanolaminetransferase (alkaline phosphatase superfamily)